ncbi:aldose 1-epimerase [Paenibacillus sp. CGMCC 1.16610]|uniref:Aldose 1-epimerase n=1 Tax=Paenibacillus anseongense TaxID=2682845 RepID=A0ABW9U1M3_9BACL|nr:MULTISPECIES: aldose 1-epimerase [Paenibacillus]MBA2940801.1 aldose 1-epimerase [Paenibacillus sp. CGMCC 1.16610]MVQ33984.1 aldose 1-epimerase [Paenibacillus anseongense]
MSTYWAGPLHKEGFSIIRLTDEESRASAELIPAIGNNLYRFTCDGVEVLMPPASLSSLWHEPNEVFKYGTPLLSPPNRVRNGRFLFKGREYKLPLNEPPDHHLHGEICSKAWKVVGYGASEKEGAWVTSQFRYADYPEIMGYFPHMLVFTMTYRLKAGRLYMEGGIENKGVEEAPFAFGLHPYFAVPFGDGEEISLRVPAAAEWPVTNQAFVIGTPEESAFSRELLQGADIENYPLLGCSLITMSQDGDRTCRIEMKNQDYTIAYQFDQTFPYVVLFRPDWASAYSLEPYTYVTDAFNLPYEHELTGARGIRAGEQVLFTTGMWIEK